jgi:hypothetical protein
LPSAAPGGTEMNEIDREVLAMVIALGIGTFWFLWVFVK